MYRSGTVPSQASTTKADLRKGRPRSLRLRVRRRGSFPPSRYKTNYDQCIELFSMKEIKARIPRPNWQRNVVIVLNEIFCHFKKATAYHGPSYHFTKPDVSLKIWTLTGHVLSKGSSKVSTSPFYQCL